MLKSKLVKAPLWGAFLFIMLGAVIAYFGSEAVRSFIQENPTAPIMFVATFIAYNGLKTQRMLARVKNAIDFQNNYLSSEISKQNIIKVIKLSNDHPAEKLRFKTLSTDDLLSVREVLNSFERMAIGIEIKVYDPEVLFRSYATTVTTVWIAFRPYILERQEETPHVYCNLDKLAAEWMMRRHEKMTNLEKKQIKNLQNQISEILKKYDK